MCNQILCQNYEQKRTNILQREQVEILFTQFTFHTLSNGKITAANSSDCYCLVAIVQHDMKLERSIYETLQILNISLTDKTSLRELFNKQNFNNVKVLNDSSEPSLFENYIY